MPTVTPQLAARFTQAVSDTVDLIADGPLQYAVVGNGRRRAGVRRFPYGLFFLIEETRIVVIACFARKEKPEAVAAARYINGHRLQDRHKSTASVRGSGTSLALRAGIAKIACPKTTRSPSGARIIISRCP